MSDTPPVHPLRAKMTLEMRVRHFSPRTEESYLHAIHQLWKYHRRSPEKLTRDEVVAFLEDCVTVRELSRSTVNVYFQACRFLYEQALGRDRLTFQLPRRRRTHTRPQIYSLAECRQLINTPRQLKHRALLHLVYGSGLRVSEVVGLQPRHIESERMMVFVEAGKGHKDRYTLLSRVALEVLREYWQAFHPRHWLFPGQDPQQPLSVAAVQQVYYQAVRQSGLRQVGGIHTLRHCFASHCMEQGLDIYTLQRLLGHTSIKTTAHYMHVSAAHLAAVKSPLDTLFDVA